MSIISVLSITIIVEGIDFHWTNFQGDCEQESYNKAIFTISPDLQWLSLGLLILLWITLGKKHMYQLSLIFYYQTDFI